MLWQNNHSRIADDFEKLHAQYTALVNENNNLQKQLEDSDAHMLENLKKIKELHEQHCALEAAAIQVVDLINPADGAAPKTILQRLQETPAMITKMVRRGCFLVGNKILATILSFYPTAELEDVPDGRAEDCSEDQFKEYLESTRPIAEKIADQLKL